MATKFITPSWRMPKNSNQSKASNYSLDFDGSSFINISNDINVSGDCTVSFWFKVPAIPNSVPEAIFARYTGSSDTDFLIIGLYLQGVLASNNSNTGGSKTTRANITLEVNTWYHCAVTKVSGVVTNIYINGTDRAGSVNTFEWWGAGSTNSSFIGQKANSDSLFDGKLSQFSIFDYTLTSNQISALYNDGIPANPLAVTTPPVAYYDLGQGSAYASGSAGIIEPNLSAATGSTVFDIPSKSVGTAKKYISTNINNLSDIDVTDKITVSTWVNFDDVTVNAYNPIINKGQLLNSSNLSFVIARTRTPSGKIYAQVKNDSSTTVTVYSDASTVSSGEWANIVMRYDGSHVKIYVDGKLYESAVQTGNILDSSPTEPVVIGTDYYYAAGLGNNLVGKVSNVQIWNTDLTDGGVSDGNIATGQIAELYNNGTPLQSNIPQSGSLKAWYKLGLDTSNWDGSKWNVGTSTSTYLNSIGPISTSNTFPTTINFGNDSSLNPSDTNKLTLSIWFNSTSTLGSATGYTIFGRGPVANAANGCYTLMARGGGGDIQFWFHDGSGTSPNPILQSSNAASTYMDGKWHHIAITVDGTLAQPELKMYIDNTLENTTTSPNTGINDVTQDLYLGQKQYTYSHLGAAYSNFCMFNTVLDATGNQSINSLYNNGTPPEDISSYSNLQFWAKLNNLTTGIIDNSSNTNNGTISGEIVSKNLVVSALNGLSSGMDTTNLVPSNLIKSIPYSGYSMETDGNNNYIDFGASTFSAGDDVTFSCWVNKSSDGAVFVWANGTNANQCNWWLNSNELTIQYGNAAASTIRLDYTFNNDEWYHILSTGTIGSPGVGYVNGVAQSTKTTGGYISSQNTSARLFSLTTHTTFDVEGKFSNFAIWNKILTQDEILRVYNGGSPGDLTSLGPTGWWSLGADSYFNGSDWICPDLSGTTNGDSENMPSGALVGIGPDSLANGTSTNLNLGSDLIGEAPGSTGNAISINMNSLARTGSTP